MDQTTTKRLIKELFELSIDSQIGMWKCVVCKYKFEAVDGYKCPRCGAIIDNAGNITYENKK